MSKKKKVYHQGKSYEVKRNNRFSESEIKTISNAFLDNEELVMILRKFFLQEELSQYEENELDKIKRNLDLMEVLRKMFVLRVDSDMPIGQLVDFWTNIDTKSELPEMSILKMKSRKITADYVEQRMDELEGEKPDTHILLEELVYSPRKSDNEALTDMDARNFTLMLIDNFSQELINLAVQGKTISPEQREQKQKLDSSK